MPHLRARWTGAVALLLSWAATLLAAEPPSADDCRLTLYARQALLRDTVLEPLNLGVTVKHYAATVWGSAPNKLLAERAIDKVRKVKGIADVYDRITIEGPAETAVPKVPKSPPPARPARTELKETWVPREQREPGRPGDQETRRQEEKETKASVQREKWRPATNRNETPSNGLPVSLSPSTRPAPAMPPVVRNTPTRTPAVTAPLDLAQMVERLCRESTHYRYLRADVKAGVVRLQGKVARGEDMFTLAQAIGRLPGVERVSVEAVRIDPLVPVTPEGDKGTR